MAAAAAADAPAAGAIAVLHEAKRGEVYGALYKGRQAVLPVRVETFETMMGEILAWQAASGARVALAGTGAGAAKAWLDARKAADFALTSVTQPDAFWVGRLALSRAVPEGAPAPLYLRAADARLAAGVVAIRPAGQADAAILAALHNDTLTETWDAEYFARAVSDGHGQALIAEARGVPVGFILCRVVADEAEVLAIGVLAATRKSGIGTRLYANPQRARLPLVLKSYY